MLDASQGGSDSLGVFAAMATPAVLLLANAMLILSTNQRLQAVLQRVRENEQTLRRQTDAATTAQVRHELEAHGRRARIAHRALLALYASAAVLLVMIGALGTALLGLSAAQPIALVGAFGGAGAAAARVRAPRDGDVDWRARHRRPDSSSSRRRPYERDLTGVDAAQNPRPLSIHKADG